MAPRSKLDFEQKKAICVFRDENPSMTQVNIISHFNDKWGTSISKSLMSTILKDKSRWMTGDKNIIKRLERTHSKSSVTTNELAEISMLQMAKKKTIEVLHWNEIERKYEYKMVERTEENDPDNMIDPDLTLEDYIYGDAPSSPAPLNLIKDEMNAIQDLCERRHNAYNDEFGAEGDDEFDGDLNDIMKDLWIVIQEAEKKKKYIPVLSSNYNLPLTKWDESGVEISTIIDRLNDVINAYRRTMDVAHISKAMLKFTHKVDNIKTANLMGYNGKTIQWNEEKRKYEYKM